MIDKIKIGDKNIGINEPAFFIAEAGINHNGDIEIAKNLIKKAKESGADAVKFQSWKTERFIVKGDFTAKHIESDGLSKDGTLYGIIKATELSKEQHIELINYANDLGIIFLSSPFDFESVDLLNDLGVPAFKVGSGDLNNLPFLQYIAQKEKAIILSTGMGTLGEIEEALDTIYKEGNREVIVLHCISVYPPKPSDINLRAMETISRSFNVTVGYSDHTIGINIPLAAIARGAKVIEKHFTLDRNMPGPDQKVSTEPQEFKEMVEKSRMIESALGSGIKKPSPDEEETKKSFRRSIIAREKISKGEKINKDQIEFKRPGTGLPPKMASFVIGRIAKNDINKDQIITEDDI